jgi:predicted secreted protein
MRFKRSSNSLVLITAMFLSGSSIAFAEHPDFYDRVRLSAQAVATVDNDTLVADLSARRQGSDAAKLAMEVNQIMAKAIKRCKQESAVEVQTRDYQTNPIYEKQHQTGWIVSQSLELKSQDTQAISRLLGDLQSSLLLQGMHYEVSPEQRSQAQDSLIRKAISNFTRRAQNITQQLGRTHYRLVSMQVDTGDVSNPPYPMQNYRVMAEARTAPALEPGKQQITVSVSGVIELLLN